MELWLLGAGAIVLVAITLWIVWPSRTPEAVGATPHSEEILQPAMTENARPTIPPQGDRFEDQYTSATADLSAGGVATAMESMQDEPSTGAPISAEDDFRPAVPTTTTGVEARSQATGATAGVEIRPPVGGATAGEPWSSPTIAREGVSEALPSGTAGRMLPAPGLGRSLAQPRTIGLGAGALLSLASAIGGAWLYARWQRERNRPLNRLRRGAQGMAGRLSQRIPDVVEDLPPAAPIGGAASALLLAAFVASRARGRGRVEESPSEIRALLRESATEAFSRGRDAVDTRGGHLRQALRQRPEPSKPMFLGLGFGGLATVGGGAYVVWRLLRRSPDHRSQNWYAGE